MWVKEALATHLPKGKTADGLKYSIHQEKYLKVFLSDGRVPIDNSALHTIILHRQKELDSNRPDQRCKKRH